MSPPCRELPMSTTDLMHDLPPAVPPVPTRGEDEFLRELIEATRTRRSWRERLQWVRDRFADPAFAPTPGHLATVAVYLRLLATGELRCEEDGRHFRPNHHAEAAQQIETALERLTTPETAWIVRRIYPYLPSWGEEFRRAEPLTRIRDIAHRNDIPPELKKEIKQRLQNKLHRCAGPEDLRTADELLRRVTIGGYGPDFVREFRLFHAELQEFFNATALETRLQEISAWCAADPIGRLLSLKAQSSLAEDQLLELLERLTELRRAFRIYSSSLPSPLGGEGSGVRGVAGTSVSPSPQPLSPEGRGALSRIPSPQPLSPEGRGALVGHESPQRRSQLRLADIGLEDYAFTVL